MGLCRGLNLVLGMTAAPEAAALFWPLALINATYITAVTLTSRSEVTGGRAFGNASVGLLTAAFAALVVLRSITVGGPYSSKLDSRLSGRLASPFQTQPGELRGACR